MPPDQCKTTIRLPRAGSLPDDPISRRWRAGPGVRTTSRNKQTWKHITDDSSNLLPFACPKCGEAIIYHVDNFVGCPKCAWSPSMMTRKERADLEAKDPEMIPVLQFLQKAEAWAPRFEGHENKKRISGNERREKRFLSKCAAVG